MDLGGILKSVVIVIGGVFLFTILYLVYKALVDKGETKKKDN